MTFGMIPGNEFSLDSGTRRRISVAYASNACMTLSDSFPGAAALTTLAHLVQVAPLGVQGRVAGRPQVTDDDTRFVAALFPELCEVIAQRQNRLQQH